MCARCNTQLLPEEQIPPFCRSCKKDYPAGTKFCPDCLVELTQFAYSSEGQRKAAAGEYTELVEAYEINSQAELALIEGALESKGLPFYAKGESISSIDALGSIGGFNPLFGPIRIMTSPKNLKAVRSAIAFALGFDEDIFSR
jgi:hypothetical protein